MENTYKLLPAQYGPYPVALTAGLLPQHPVRPPIHLDASPLGLTTCLGGIQNLAPGMGSQRLIHYANPPRLTFRTLYNLLTLIDFLRAV